MVQSCVQEGQEAALCGMSQNSCPEFGLAAFHRCQVEEGQLLVLLSAMKLETEAFRICRELGIAALSLQCKRPSFRSRRLRTLPTTDVLGIMPTVHGMRPSMQEEHIKLQ